MAYRNKKDLYDYQMKRWRDRKDKAIEYKGGCCERCGFTGNRACFDFHHIGGKDFVWTKLRLRAWDSVLAELDRCELLCANCHRLEHTIYD